MSSELDAAKYVSFTSYKKDGTPVSLPVWVVPFNGGYAFTTDSNSYKIKRIKNDARATLRVCDIRGKVSDGAQEFPGAAVVLGADDVARVTELVKKKYRIGWALLGVTAAWKKLTGKGSTATAESAIKVTINP
ncbi:MAG: hypothetical protein RI912_1635 [Actinomycetota bacterium]|jgi:PPOX class probable F420-dependent enzyme